MPNITVAYLIPSTSLSGGINIVLEHANRLRAVGVDTHIYTCDENTSLKWHTHNKIPIKYIRNLPTLLEISVTNFDVFVLTGWQTLYEALDLNVKAKSFAYFVQSIESRFYSTDTCEHELSKFTYRFNLNYLTEAKWIKDYLSGIGQMSAYVPNWVNTDIFYPDQPLIPQGAALRVLIEGPINIPFKGVDLAFLAVKDLPGIETWCVSSAGKPKPWHEVSYFFGSQPIHGMRSIYSSCDVLLKMSEVEGVFGPPLEMMACGGTAIVSRVTGSEEYIRNGTNAIEIAPRAWTEAREQLIRLRDNRDELKRLKTGAAKTVMSYSWDKTIALLKKFYVNLARDPNGVTIFDIVRKTGFLDEARLALRLYLKTFGREPRVDYVSAERSYIDGDLLPPSPVTEGVLLRGWAFSLRTGSNTKIRVEAESGQAFRSSIVRHSRPDVDQALNVEDSMAGFSACVLPINYQSGSDSFPKMRVQAQIGKHWITLPVSGKSFRSPVGYIESVTNIQVAEWNVPDKCRELPEGFVICLLAERPISTAATIEGDKLREMTLVYGGANSLGHLSELDDLGMLERAIANGRITLVLPRECGEVNVYLRRGFRV